MPFSKLKMCCYYKGLISFQIYYINCMLIPSHIIDSGSSFYIKPIRRAQLQSFLNKRTKVKIGKLISKNQNQNQNLNFYFQVFLWYVVVYSVTGWKRLLNWDLQCWWWAVNKTWTRRWGSPLRRIWSERRCCWQSCRISRDSDYGLILVILHTNYWMSTTILLFGITRQKASSLLRKLAFLNLWKMSYN